MAESRVDIDAADPLPLNRTSSFGQKEPRPSFRAVFTHGRPPWYRLDGHQEKALVIGVCGGSASGKTTLANRIIECLNIRWVCLLSMDSFYKASVLNEEEHARAAKSNYDFDCPEAFDIDLLVETLKELKAGRSVEVPTYNFVTHSREPGYTMYGANVIVFEGIMAYCDQRVRDLLDVKIFVTEDADVRLARRLLRDTNERGREVKGSITQYNRFVYPAFKNHIEPTMQFADLVIPRGVSNPVALDLIITKVKEGLASRGHDLRGMAARDGDMEDPSSLHYVPASDQLHGLMTTIRDRDSSRDDFVFSTNRVLRLTVEHALSLCPFEDVVVETAVGTYLGRRRTHQITGVSIVRAGMSFEEPLRQCVRDVNIGQILIQTNLTTGQPEFFHKVLPNGISNHKVMLMDATLATGASAMMAIRVLMDHHVPEENIILVVLMAASMGVAQVAYAFPKVQIVVAAMDRVVDNQFRIHPGLGNFGDRFYGTEHLGDRTTTSPT
ncbi:uncharacterized protein MONBRDRAFT_17791 [Monosiga brevicollis MX1]|uniref:Uridine kinase n=1 Tax=Monosiga brevicollis TaxID=81824 RepID=A9URE0_MONBE|nr:uncharacterized protein MONBRDRAFT_17791 [Monosiga brevicollis MX1]EDQ91906.1 predicted protein [Monosiga brevicollis MX1]|eukprot:XP_001743192.1 hypothetical protein [Monosiga brevicollis MX1]